MKAESNTENKARQDSEEEVHSQDTTVERNNIHSAGNSIHTEAKSSTPSLTVVVVVVVITAMAEAAGS